MPQLENGFLQYTIVEVVAASDGDSGWVVKALPLQQIPVATGPTAVSFGAIDGLENRRSSKMAIQPQVETLAWSRAGVSVE